MGAVSATYRAETRITLAAYHEAGMAYEKGATEIRADLGDSIRYNLLLSIFFFCP